MKASKDPLIILPADDFEGTMKAIQATIYQYAHQTKSDFFEFNDYKENDLFEDYKWLWQWTRQQIKYRLDAPLKEEIRTPARTWYDRKKGVDCEDYVIFVSTILLNNRIPHFLRVADYGSGWQHIYVVVPGANKKEIVIDPVKDRFNTEQPFINKKDYKIRLNGKGLSGIENDFKKKITIKPTQYKEGDYIKLFQHYEGVIQGIHDITRPSYFVISYDGDLFIQSESTIVPSTQKAFDDAVSQYQKGVIKGLKLRRKEKNKENDANRKLAATNKAKAFDINQQIEQLLDSQTKLNQSELQFLKNYTGSGGKGKDGATGEGILYEFYTPDWVAQLMWEIAQAHGYDGGNVLETSCGTGVFLDTAPENTENNFVAFEVNPYAAKIAQLRHPNAKVYNQYFETAFLDPQARFRTKLKSKLTWLESYPFDLVIGNPPYGIYQNQYSSYFPELQKKGIKQMEIAFMYWGLKMLKPNGLLVYVTSQNFMRTGFAYQNAKEAIGQIADLVDAYRLPSVFESTQVPTDILVFRKNEKAH